MEILSHKNHQELLDYLPHVKSSLKEWLFVDVRLTGNSDKNFVISNAADLIHSLFESKEGKLFICNDREILMLREYEQLSYAEIAGMLRLPLNTVRSRLFRARMALKEQLMPVRGSN